MPATLDTARERAVDLLRASAKFLVWNRPRLEGIGKLKMMAERHFKPEELAELWGVSTETIRSIFREEEGVLKIGKTGGKYKRGYATRQFA